MGVTDSWEKSVAEMDSPIALARCRALLSWLRCLYHHPILEILFPGIAWICVCMALWLPEIPQLIAGCIIAVGAFFFWIRLPNVPRNLTNDDWNPLIEEVNDAYQAALCITDMKHAPIVREDILQILREEMHSVKPLTSDEEAALNRYLQRKEVLVPCIACCYERIISAKHYMLIECTAVLGQVLACVLLMLTGRQIFGTHETFLFYAVCCSCISLLGIWIVWRSSERSSFLKKRGDSDELFQRIQRLYVRKFLSQCDCWNKWGGQNALSLKVTIDELRYHEALAQSGDLDALDKLREYANRGSADALFAMGNLFYRGYPNTPQDIPESVHWFEKAAERDHIEALNTLGWIYQHGFGDVHKDIARALQFWEKSANLGNMTAQRKLALLYENGNGVEKNIQKAIEWYTRASEQNDDKSLYNLGCLYFRGKEVPKDLEKALHYFKLSDELGNELAHNMIKWMY